MTRNPAPLAAPHPPRRGRKYFTLDEANRALPYVSRIVEDIAGCYRQAVELRQQIEQTQTAKQIEKLREQYDKLMDQLNEYLDELHHVGVEIKDFEKGLLDFPAVHEGREIYFCWHRGELRIASWHELDAGYAGRQDVALLNRAS